jgi:hypothetical protein
MQICAAQNGRVLNIASIAGDTGISAATARRYISILEVSFQIARITPYSVNRGKRLIKSPRIYWTDTGLAAHLAGIYSEESLVNDREFGLWLENWVGIHLLVYASLKIPRISVSHWRTSSGHEVDFIIEYGKKIMPIEVKTTSRPSGKDLQGLETFLGTYPETPFGIIACQCEKPVILSSNIVAIPVTQLLLT